MLLDIEMFRSLVHSSFITPIADIIRAQPDNPALTTAPN
jgi:hypothetical protein